MSRTSGQADRTGTERFRDRSVATRHLPKAHFRSAPGDLALSSVGLGTYIGAPDAATDIAVEQAVSLSLASGRLNVIDTAINYRHQRAERSVGRALARMFETGQLSRTEVFVSTKNGYLAPDGEAAIPAERWVDQTLVKPGILKRSEIVDGSHSMAEGFLRDQLERSRENLKLETIDLLYLHNAADAQLPSVGKKEFFARLELAFRLYEGFRRDGQIRAYGLATWECLRAPRSAPVHLSLEETVHLARKVGGADHGFRFVQFPFSLVLPEAATLRNQRIAGEDVTLFEAVRRLGLGGFTSVPLHQGQLSRAAPSIDGLTRAQTALQFARSAPGTLGPVVGLKRPEHLSENLRLAEVPPWDAPQFEALLPP